MMPVTISKSSLALILLSRCCNRRKCPFGHVMKDIVEEFEECSHNEGLEVVVEGGGEGSEGGGLFALLVMAQLQL